MEGAAGEVEPSRVTVLECGMTCGTCLSWFQTERQKMERSSYGTCHHGPPGKCTSSGRYEFPATQQTEGCRQWETDTQPPDGMVET